jgi:hypothetical protein
VFPLTAAPNSLVRGGVYHAPIRQLEIMGNLTKEDLMDHLIQIESPGVEPTSPGDETVVIGGRADTWPQPGSDDDHFEPTIIRGRE